MASEDISLDPSWTKPVGWEKGKREKREKRRESSRERSSTFSLSFLAVGMANSGEARGKVHPLAKISASRPKSGSFDKLQEVGVFFYLV